MDWQQIKETIAVWTGLERDALHVYAALLVQVASALVLRKSLAHWWPWTCVLVLAAGNEFLDLYGDDLVEQWEIDGGLHDLWNTMLLPSLLLLLARFAPNLIVPPRATASPEEPAAGQLDD